MLMRGSAVMLLVSAGIAGEGMSYSFVSKGRGRLGGPIRLEFYRDSTTRPKTDIESFTVSMRTADDRWKAMWSILSGRGLTQPIEYGVDRKSTRLNSSHQIISYAVFCLKKKKTT